VLRCATSRVSSVEQRHVGFVRSKKLQAWSEFLDSDLQHSHRVARFAVQLYDGLTAFGMLDGSGKNSRELLRASALVHEVGRIDGNKNHHKKTPQMIVQLDRLAGWTRQHIATMESVARYHRGVLPQSGKLRDFPVAQRRTIKLVSRHSSSC
jgi:exopolyphosphatase/pppGpp-phosphohydrolase